MLERALVSLGIPVPSDSEESDDELSDSDDCVPDSDVSHDGGDQALPSLLEIVKKKQFQLVPNNGSCDSPVSRRNCS